MGEPEGRFDTYLLSLEEVWYVRENPTLLLAVRVRSVVEEIEELEQELEERRAVLERHMVALNKRRLAGNGRK